MAAAKKGESRLVVLAQFAFPMALSGEVVQLHKHDVVDTERFRPESLEHLKSIGFIGESE